MGGNYYLYKPAFTKQQIMQAVEEERYDDVKDMIDENEKCKYHIGKRSGGWTFTFDHNNWVFFENREELDKWLKSGQILFDDGTKVTFDDFWQNVNERASGKIDPTDKVHFDLFFRPHTDFS